MHGGPHHALRVDRIDVGFLLCTLLKPKQKPARWPVGTNTDFLSPLQEEKQENG